MRKLILKYISLMMVAAMMLSAVPAISFVGPRTARAFDDVDIEELDEEDLAIYNSIKAPAKVAKPTAKRVKKNTYTISWKKIDKNCKGYDIQVSPYADFDYPEDPDYEEDEDAELTEDEEIIEATVGKKKTSYKVSGLTKGNTYYVRVRAYNESEDMRKPGKWSKVIKFKAK